MQFNFAWMCSEHTVAASQCRPTSAHPMVGQYHPMVGQHHPMVGQHQLTQWSNDLHNLLKNREGLWNDLVKRVTDTSNHSLKRRASSCASVVHCFTACIYYEYMWWMVHNALFAPAHNYVNYAWRAMTIYPVTSTWPFQAKSNFH